MDSMCQEVEAWLQKIYKSDLYPKFEKNEETVSHLYQLLKSHQQKTRDGELLLKEIEEQERRYKIEGLI